MKKIITLLAVAILSVSAVSAQKYGHLNAQEVMLEMVEYQTAAKEMDRYGAQKQKEVEMSTAAFQSEVKKYQAESATLSTDIKASREKDLLEMQEAVEASKRKAQEKMQKKEAELLEPIIKKVREAIKVVGKANGFTYIFDTSAGALLYFEGGNDVSELLKKELAKPAAPVATGK